MLFTPEHVEMIKKGVKTQTRRDWKKRMVKVGGVYKVKTKMLSKDYHCKIMVDNIRQELLKRISEEDAKKEGCKDVWEYFLVWSKINKRWNGDLCVYVIDFHLVERSIT